MGDCFEMVFCMTPHQAEQQDNDRLRKSADSLEYAKQKENEARKALAEAVERTKRMKEKHEALFAECEKRAGERRKNGQIPNSSQY